MSLSYRKVRSISRPSNTKPIGNNGQLFPNYSLKAIGSTHQNTSETVFDLGVVRVSGGSVQKKFNYTNGKAVKDHGHKLGVWTGTFNDRSLTGMSGLAELINGLTPKQALTMGVCGREGAQKLITQDKYDRLFGEEDEPGTITRTKRFLSHSEHYFVLIDIDPEPGSVLLSPDETMATLAGVDPSFKGVGQVVTKSSSSQIFHRETGKCLAGEGNFHIYVAVKGDLDRAKEHLKHKLWAAGHGRFILAQPNADTGVPSRLERGLLDWAVLSSERFCYEAVALLPHALESRRGQAVATEGKVLDLASIIATPEEIALAKVNRDRAEAEIKFLQLEQTVQVVLKQDSSLSRHDALTVARRRVELVERGVLPRCHRLFLSDGSILTAGQLTEEHLGQTLSDPQEPSYDNGRFCAQVIRVKGGAIGISSYAHGEAKYLIAPETSNAVWVAPTLDTDQPYTINLCGASSQNLMDRVNVGGGGSQEIWVGSSGGCFDESELDSLLLKYPSPTLVFHPNGGDWKNPAMVDSFRKLASFVEERNKSKGKKGKSKSKKNKGLGITVAWFGQFEQTAPGAELVIPDEVQALSSKEYLRFCWKTTQGDLKNWQASKTLTPDDTIDSKYFEYRHPDGGEIFAVKAGLGGGKTHYIGQVLQAETKKNQTLKAVIFAPTNILCEGLQARLEKDWGLTSQHPKDVDFAALKQSGKGAIFVVCPDSIGLVPLWFMKNHFFIVDEAIGCQSALVSRVAVDKRDDCIERFRYGLQHCDRGLLFDGNLTDRTIAWASSGTGRSVFTIQNDRKTNLYRLFLYLSKSRLMEELERHDILSNPIALAGDNLAIIDTVKALLERNPAAKGKVICSKTAHEDWFPKAIRNATKFIQDENLNVFAFSPSAESGVDISTKDHFGAVYGFLVGVIGPDSQSQILARTRQTVDRHVFVNTVGIWDAQASGTTTAEAVNKALKDFKVAQGNAVLSGSDYAEDLAKFIKLVEEAASSRESQFESARMAIDNIEKANLLPCRILNSLAAGHTVHIVGGDVEKPDLQRETANFTKARKTARAVRMLEAPLVQEEDIEAMKQSRKARTPEQDALCDRFFLEMRLPGIADTEPWADVSVNEKDGTVSNVEFARSLLESDVIDAAENWYAYNHLKNSKRGELDGLLRCLETGRIDLTKKSRFSRVKALKDAGFDNILELDGEFTGKHPVITKFLGKFRKSASSHGMNLHPDPMTAIKKVCKYLGLDVIGNRTKKGRSYEVDALTHEGSIWAKNIYLLVAEKRRLISEKYAIDDSQEIEKKESEKPSNTGFEYDTTPFKSLRRLVEVVSSNEAQIPAPKTDLAEWRDFIESERQKNHTADSLRAMSSQMDFVPSRVWEAIAA